MKNFKLGAVSGAIQMTADASADINLLDPLVGTWKGTGFNQIWRPANIKTSGGNPDPNQDRFLELNETLETLTFKRIEGVIPNRGLLQQTDINLLGISYEQNIQDANVKDNGQNVGIHFEPGIWLSIPATHSNPIINVPTVARMATIPHGVSIVTQGIRKDGQGGPSIKPVDITPFEIGQPDKKIHFPESILTNQTKFRTAAKDIPHVTQAMVDNPNSVLTNAIAGKNIVKTTVYTISTQPTTPIPTGGGNSNISFLEGQNNNPNARSAQVDAIFWIEEVHEPNGKVTFLLQYTQTVLLNFNTLSWPHVSVATLVKQ